MMVIETERLRLRELEPDQDGPFMLAVLNERGFIENVADRGVRTVEQATDYIREKMMPSYAEFGFGFYVIELKASGEPIGICGLIKRPVMDDVDIGYSILEPHWRRGYAYEAALAVMDYGRRVLKIPRIVAITAPHNTSSMKLLEKLGLRFQCRFQLPGYPTESMLFAEQS